MNRNTAGEYTIENYDGLQAELDALTADCGEVIYEGQSLEAAIRSRNGLKRIKGQLEELRCRMRSERLRPSAETEIRQKRLNEAADRALAMIREFISVEEEELRRQRRTELERFYRSEAKPLGRLSELIWRGGAFYESRWDELQISQKRCQREIKLKIERITGELALLRADGGVYTAPLAVRYAETLTLEGLDKYRRALERIDGSIREMADGVRADYEDNVAGYKILKLSGAASQLERSVSLLYLSGIGCEELEDGIPPLMSEVTEPDTDSFVAFDLEISGSYGVAAGDRPAEIIEFGAVRVENGRIAASFSSLCNPGRSIVPLVEELTGITDEMVADKQSVSEAIREFAAFCADSLLVGHGILNSDILYVTRAARREGIAMPNSFFDTCRYAERNRAALGLESLKLSAVAEKLGVELIKSHRALGDAQAAAGVYLAERSYDKKRSRSNGRKTQPL